MAYETILYAKDGGVATITINRPKVLNALNPQVVAELGQAVAEVAADDEVKVVILTGSGPRALPANNT